MVQRFVAYERVSTARQGASGLGLEAQRQAIDGFAALKGADALARFTEVESGKNPNRPELTAAIRLARLTGATLIIAKLDRLSRNAAFLLTLRDSGVRFLAVDMPEANDLTVGIMPVTWRSGRPNSAFSVRQVWMAASVNVGCRPRLPVGAASHCVPGSNQIDSEPAA